MRERKVAGAFPKAKEGVGVEIKADLARAAYKIRVLSLEGVLELLWGRPGALETRPGAADNQGREGESVVRRRL